MVAYVMRGCGWKSLIQPFFLVPAGMLYLAHHQSWAQKVGVILLCCITGLLVGNMGLIPDAMADVQQSVSDITVALALPTLLFTLDIRQWSKMAGKAIIIQVFELMAA